MEQLYEDKISHKVAGSQYIEFLARKPENIEDLVHNEQLMSLLTRTLKNDFKKSRDLCLNITRAFFCFSNYTNFHAALTESGIGRITLRVCELEIYRYSQFIVKDLVRLERIARVRQRGDREKSSMWDGVSESVYTRHGELVPKEKVDVGRELRNIREVVHKQDNLLFVSFHVLLNLAENRSVEKKMARKNIIVFLCDCLDREWHAGNAELGMLLVTFLKRLSVTDTHRQNMVSNHAIIARLSVFFPDSEDGGGGGGGGGGKGDRRSRKKRSLQYRLKKEPWRLPVTHMVLRLLLNLSFEPVARANMIEKGLVPQLAGMLKVCVCVCVCVWLCCCVLLWFDEP